MTNVRGFTLIEILLSVALIAMLAGLSLPLYASFQNRNQLDLNTTAVVEMLRRAQLYSRSVNGDSQWGVNIQAGAVTLFKGSSFASRDTSYDEALSLSESTSGLSEIVYSKLSGTPNTTGNIVLTSVNNETRTVAINAKGTVSY